MCLIFLLYQLLKIALGINSKIKYPEQLGKSTQSSIKEKDALVFFTN